MVGHVDNRDKFVCISNKPLLLLHLKQQQQPEINLLIAQT
jgi:hypothetical protein